MGSFAFQMGRLMWLLSSEKPAPEQTKAAANEVAWHRVRLRITFASS